MHNLKDFLILNKKRLIEAQKVFFFNEIYSFHIHQSTQPSCKLTDGAVSFRDYPEWLGGPTTMHLHGTQVDVRGAITAADWLVHVRTMLGAVTPACVWSMLLKDNPE